MAGILLYCRHFGRLLTLVCLLLTSYVAVAQVGDQQLTKIANWNAYVHLPDDYNSLPTKQYPVIVFIPGLGEVGTDPAKLLVYGPGYYIKQGKSMNFTVNGTVEKPIVISLQPSGAWPNGDVINTRIDSILKRWRVDPKRLYLTGLSMGGFAADNYITTKAAYAQKVAAIVAMSAVEPNNALTNLRPYALNGGKWWGFEGSTDYRKMDLIRDTLNKITPGSARYTQYVGGHCCWNTWYNPTWTENGENIYEWMLKQSLGGSIPVNQPPVANAGSDMTITEGTTITINSSGSTDPDGTIASKTWTITNTGTGVVVLNQSATLPSTLPVGTYRVVLKVTDNQGATATDEMMLTVQAAPVVTNQPPVVNAGIDRVFGLGSTISINATVTDADGTIASQSWTITNTETGVVVYAGVATFPSTLPKGKYKAVLTAIDNSGASASDEMLLEVNESPKAIAGLDLTIKGPVSEFTISSNRSYDENGSIVGYTWTRISGPGAVTIKNQFTATPTFTPLEIGMHVFQLTVTDNSGLTGADTVRITVTDPSGNQPVVTETQRNRVLIDVGPSPSAGVTTGKDQWGKYWNNITDGRAGTRLTNAVDTANKATTLGVEILTRIDGTFSTSGNGMNGGNTIGNVGDYPASATNDNAFGHSSTTAGTWRVYGLNPSLTYSFKFWGSRSASGIRTLQIKKSTDADYTQESNAVNNTDYNNAMYFEGITGVTEVVFNMRIKPGQTYGNISVIDIVSTSQTPQAAQSSAPASAAAPLMVEAKAVAPAHAAIQIWPNPTTGNSTVQVANSYRGQTTLNILSSNGSVIRTATLTKVQESMSYPVSLSGMPKGIYYIKIQMGTQTEMKKLIVQ